MDHPPTLVQRQTFRPQTTVLPDGYIIENGRFVPYWYTRQGIIIKWTVFLILLTLITMYIVLGYWHAKRRLARGLPPLSYHRWLVSRAQLAQVDPRYAYHNQGPPYATYRPEYHHMQPNMPPPPPMYDPMGRPPVYEPQPDVTKPAAAAPMAPAYRP